VQIKDRFKHEPVIYRQFLNILQLYKDNNLDIASVKAKVANLFSRHTDLLARFSIFLPEQEPMTQEDMGGCGGGRLGMGGGGSRKHRRGEQDDDADDDIFMPEPGDDAGLLLYDLKSQIVAQHGHEAYRHFLKCLSLVTAGVLTPDEFGGMLHEKMLTGSGPLKSNFVHFKNLVGAKPSVYPTISEVDLTNCAKCGISYKKLPRDHLPPLCSGRTPFWNALLNDEWVSVSSGREDFGHMKRTQHEVAMFLCEDDRYELDMLVEANVSTMLAIKDRLAQLPEPEGDVMVDDDDDMADADEDKVERVRTLRERPTADNVAGDDAASYYFPGEEVLKPRNMKIVQMVYGDSWPELAALMRRAPGVTLRVLLKRLQRKDVEWRKTRRDMNRIWSTVYHNNYHKSLDHRSFQVTFLKSQLATQSTVLNHYKADF